MAVLDKLALAVNPYFRKYTNTRSLGFAVAVLTLGGFGAVFAVLFTSCPMSYKMETITGTLASQYYWKFIASENAGTKFCTVWTSTTDTSGVDAKMKTCAYQPTPADGDDWQWCTADRVKAAAPKYYDKLYGPTGVFGLSGWKSPKDAQDGHVAKGGVQTCGFATGTATANMTIETAAISDVLYQHAWLVETPLCPTLLGAFGSALAYIAYIELAATLIIVPLLIGLGCSKPKAHNASVLGLLKGAGMAEVADDVAEKLGVNTSLAKVSPT